MKDISKKFLTEENGKLVVLTLLALVLIPLLSWIAFFRKTKRQPFLNPDVWQELPLVEKEVITHNTRRFRCVQGPKVLFKTISVVLSLHCRPQIGSMHARFALPQKDQPIGLPIGQHISLKALKPAADGTEIFKPYTPVSDDDLLGYVDFVIKVMSTSNALKFT
jgi:cytochrome-b5 reductase